MQSIQNSFFFPKISSLLHSSEQSVLTEESSASPDNVRSGVDPGVFKPVTITFFSNSLSLSKSQPTSDFWTPPFDSGDQQLQELMRGVPGVLLL
jgi:hypothetical protein